MSDVDDLVTWLRAQMTARVRELDEDERVALEANPAPWTVDPADGGTATIGHAGPINPTPWVVHPDEYGDGIQPADAEHIARWDPERVLRQVTDGRAEVEAMRLILDRYEDALARQDDPDHSSIRANVQVAEFEDWILPLLALPMAGRDGYRAEWRP